VIGGVAQLGEILEQTEPETALVTIPHAELDVLDEIVRICDRAGVSCRFVRREVDLDPLEILSEAEAEVNGAGAEVHRAQ
jgi:hypothetical protein